MLIKGAAMLNLELGIVEIRPTLRSEALVCTVERLLV